jgi:hypothetical protein
MIPIQIKQFFRLIIIINDFRKEISISKRNLSYKTMSHIKQYRSRMVDREE